MEGVYYVQVVSDTPWRHGSCPYSCALRTFLRGDSREPRIVQCWWSLYACRMPADIYGFLPWPHADEDKQVQGSSGMCADALSASGLWTDAVWTDALPACLYSVVLSPNISNLNHDSRGCPVWTAALAC